MRLVFQARLGLLCVASSPVTQRRAFNSVLTDTDWLFPRRRFIQLWPETKGGGGGDSGWRRRFGIKYTMLQQHRVFFFFFLADLRAEGVTQMSSLCSRV